MTPATSPYNFPPYLLNPFTPMAFLPPDDAYRNTIMGYVIVGGLSVFVWDFLIHIPTDYRLVVKHNVKFPTVIYYLSRWSILRDQFTYEVGDQTKSNFFGRGLPAFSRALLQDGQKYYMVAMIANLLVLIMEFAPGIPLIYRTIFLATGVVLTNIMACRVFRHTKMGCKCKDSQAMSALVFNTNNIASVRIRNHINTVGVHSTLSDVGDISSRNVEGALSGYPTSEKLLAYQRR